MYRLGSHMVSNMNVVEVVSRPGAEIPPRRALEAEADHRIGNNLALIAAMLRLQANDIARLSKPVPPDEVRNLLAETAARIESVGQLHRLLASAEGGAIIDAGEYIRQVVTSIAASIAGSDRATTTFDVTACHLHANQVMPLGLIVGEVVSNALKYAHPTGLPVAMSVECRASGDRIELTIADDGVGLPEGFDPHTDGGLGFRLMRSLTAQIGAAMRFDSNPMGLRFRLTIPT